MTSKSQILYTTSVSMELFTFQANTNFYTAYEDRSKMTGQTEIMCRDTKETSPDKWSQLKMVEQGEIMTDLISIEHDWLECSCPASEV